MHTWYKKRSAFFILFHKEVNTFGLYLYCVATYDWVVLLCCLQSRDSSGAIQILFLFCIYTSKYLLLKNCTRYVVLVY